MSERDEFEAWYGNINNCLERDGGYYIRGDVQNDWEVWQAALAPQAVPTLTWVGLTDKERDGFVDEIVMHGTGFVTPLYAIIEEIEGLLRAKNAAAPKPSPEAITECAEIDHEAWKSLKAHAHDWRFSLQDHLYKCDCGATRGDYPFGAASFKD